MFAKLAVLLMAGKDADATGAGRAGKQLLAVLPRATLAEFPALDHFAPEKRPEEVAEAVSEFFSQVTNLDSASARSGRR